MQEDKEVKFGKIPRFNGYIKLNIIWRATLREAAKLMENVTLRENKAGPRIDP